MLDNDTTCKQHHSKHQTVLQLGVLLYYIVKTIGMYQLYNTLENVALIIFMYNITTKTFNIQHTSLLWHSANQLDYSVNANMYIFNALLAFWTR